MQRAVSGTRYTRLHNVRQHFDMLVILTTHPIQYQTPIWQALAKDGRTPFEVWYLTAHGIKPSFDRGFGQSFAWDIDMLAGYPHRFLARAEDANPDSFWRCRLREPLRERLRAAGASAVLIQGWQVAAYWQAVREARAVGAEVWLRGESNDLAPTPFPKNMLKRAVLGALFARIDRFLCIGAANRRLYQSYGVSSSRLYAAPYAVDNERFARQAEALRPRRAELRRRWGIAEDAFCVLFCGKMIAKKRPMDLVAAANVLRAQGRLSNIHLLFAGSGELDDRLRGSCDVAFDAVSRAGARDDGVPASFAGFLNQTEISQAYVAADCLVLPSDAGETWGLVVNEALASGVPCLASDACGCAEDLAGPAHSFPIGDVAALADRLEQLYRAQPVASRDNLPAFSDCVNAIHRAYDDCRSAHGVAARVFAQ